MRLTPAHALAAVLGFLLGLSVGSIWQVPPPDVKVWENRVAAYQDSVAASEKVIAVLHGEVAREREKSRLAEVAAATSMVEATLAARDKRKARERADSLVTEITSKTSAADSLPVLVLALAERTIQANAAEEEILSLRVAFAAQKDATARLTVALGASDSLVGHLTKRLAGADELLRNHPKSDRCRVLFVPCPSRTTTFVVGAVLGAIGGVYVAGH